MSLLLLFGGPGVPAPPPPAPVVADEAGPGFPRLLYVLPDDARVRARIGLRVSLTVRSEVLGEDEEELLALLIDSDW